ncbi:MAG: DUF350 domain-containing protein [Anaerolineae bacterium]|jgi:uncharacterized membrane protein YjfL (UPF0719 family)|nr:DUF350 domain-containing protein [Anaerolineae bacterium]
MAQLGQLIISVANIIIAVILGVIASYIGVWLFAKSTRHLDDWGEVRRGNTGMGIVMGAIIIGIAIILKPAIDLPLTVEVERPFLVLLGEIIGIAVGLVLAVSAIVFSVGMFDRLVGDIDELSELQRGNMAVAVIMAAVILAISLLISGAVASIIRWFTIVLAA